MRYCWAMEAALSDAPRAGLRDRYYRRFTHRNFRRAEECDTLIDWLAPAPGQRILDIGCGDGFYSYRIAERGAHVVGIDVHEKRLQIARARNTTERTEYHYLDATRIAFAPQSFDKAVSFCVVEHLSDDEQVFRHVHRVLKPGGKFVFSADSLTNPGIREEEREAHRRRYAVNTFYDVPLVERKLRASGFRIDRTHYILAHPLTLEVARLSWKIDDLERAAIREPLYSVVNRVGRLVTRLFEPRVKERSFGLTLLIESTRV